MLCPVMSDKSPTTVAEKRLLWLIRDLVAQSCADYKKSATPAYDDPIHVFSGFIGIRAEAIALLAEYGLVKDLADNGGRVVRGKLLPVGEAAKVLKTGPFRPKEDVNPLPSAADLDAVAQEDSAREATQK